MNFESEPSAVLDHIPRESDLRRQGWRVDAYFSLLPHYSGCAHGRFLLALSRGRTAEREWLARSVTSLRGLKCVERRSRHHRGWPMLQCLLRPTLATRLLYNDNIDVVKDD